VVVAATRKIGAGQGKSKIKFGGLANLRLWPDGQGFLPPKSPVISCPLNYRHGLGIRDLTGNQEKSLDFS